MRVPLRLLLLQQGPLEQEVAQIYLMDPIFTLNAERAKEICRFVSQHNRRKIAFRNGASP